MFMLLSLILSVPRSLSMTPTAFLAKMRFWYQNDPVNTENQFFLCYLIIHTTLFLPDITKNRLAYLQFAIFCLEPEGPIEQIGPCGPIRISFTKFISICLVPKGPI